MKEGDLVQLKETLDPYHARRRDIHGVAYVVERVTNGLIEARSVGTGVLLTLDETSLEKVAPDGP